MADGNKHRKLTVDDDAENLM